jgi:hypothetical protein
VAGDPGRTRDGFRARARTVLGLRNAGVAGEGEEEICSERKRERKTKINIYAKQKRQNIFFYELVL